MEDAIADRDTIYGVIKGYAINNDGSVKVGYTAPGVDGQSDVIAEAMEMAGYSGDDIDYIETHGTATELGDMIEITALTNVFRESTDRVGDCYLGSLKSNVGHLDTAAGAGGLIKTILSMQNGVIPPVCHFTEPNPKLNLETSPFKVPSEAEPWPIFSDKPKIAGVSAFGIGGTNAHVVIESPSVTENVQGNSQKLSTEAAFLFPFSARSASALKKMALEMADWLSVNHSVSIQDLAYTLQCGRQHFPHRFALIIENDAKAIDTLIKELQSITPEQFVFQEQSIEEPSLTQELQLNSEQLLDPS
ncbi:MAG: ketoacyl-synthetase C-terminal extension domain-containing protein, partial [Balneolaceae bacterium]